MTVGDIDSKPGRLLDCRDDRTLSDGEVTVHVSAKTGRINADLTVGANVSGAVALKANLGITSMGVMIAGSGFIVSKPQAIGLGLGRTPGLEAHIRDYRNGRDLTDQPRNSLIIDLYGLSEREVREAFPSTYQWIYERVRPERLANRDKAFREMWWLHGRQRPALREMLRGLERFIVTVETSKHRHFQFLPTSVLPDHRLIAFGIQDAFELGVLSSYAHKVWTLAAGGTLEDRPVYNKSKCFDPYPFPAFNLVCRARIRNLAEQLDAHRKRQQILYPELTLTGMYNVLEKLKSGEPLSAKDKTIHEEGLVSVLKQLHDELDLAVLEAYGWSDFVPLMQVINGNAAPGTNGTPTSREDAKRALDEALLERLVALNAERVAEEAEGRIRWLRPEFQKALAGEAATPAPRQGSLVPQEEEAPAVAGTGRTPWPKDLPEQLRGVAELLARSRKPLDEDAIAARFTGRGSWKKRLPLLIETLVTLGRARKVGGGYVSGA